MAAGPRSANAFWKKICLALFALVTVGITYHGLHSSDAARLNFSDNTSSNIVDKPLAEGVFDKSQTERVFDKTQMAIIVGENQTEVVFDEEIVDGLSASQCSQEFPDLQYEIDRAVAYWQEQEQIIATSDIDISWRKDGGVRFLIHDNEQRILEDIASISFWGYRQRAIGQLSLIQRAIESAIAAGERLPSIEASIVFQDNVDPPIEDGIRSHWTVGRFKDSDTHRRLWLMPNFDFWDDISIGTYREFQRRAKAYDAPGAATSMAGKVY